jgi:hypothetical protein
MVVTVVKIESRSFSSAEITTFYNWNYAEWLELENTYDLYVVYRKNYYKLAVKKDRDSIFTTVTTIWKPGFR